MMYVRKSEPPCPQWHIELSETSFEPLKLKARAGLEEFDAQTVGPREEKKYALSAYEIPAKKHSPQNGILGANFSTFGSVEAQCTPLVHENRESVNSYKGRGGKDAPKGPLPIAILAAISYWNWTIFYDFWIHENHRGHGLGTKMLKQAEQLAQSHKSTGVWLETMSWQAPDFYEKHGYKKFGELPNYPEGHTKIFYAKIF